MLPRTCTDGSDYGPRTGIGIGIISASSWTSPWQFLSEGGAWAEVVRGGLFRVAIARRTGREEAALADLVVCASLGCCTTAVRGWVCSARGIRASVG